MKTACFLFLLALPLRAADLPAPEADNARPLSSQITDVTAFADRAQIIRKARVTLTGEPALFAISKLPGWLDEGSIRASLNPPDAGQILDVQIRRTYLSKPSDEEFQKAEVSVREIADEIAALDDEKALLNAQTKQVDAIRVFSLEKIPRDTALREVKPDEYSKSLDFISEALRKINVARRALDHKRRDLQPELEARQRKMEDLRQRAQLEQRTIVITIKGNKEAELQLGYMLPGATWEPVHELRAQQDAPSVSLSSYAIVSQTTGEDWADVNLALSTQRSTDTMKIPELEALFVGTGRHIARVVTSSGDSFASASKSYMGQNGAWFNVRNPDSGSQQEYLGNQVLLMDNQRKAEHLFETLQQRGTTAHFSALARQTIRSDGRQSRVPLGSATLSAQHRVIAAPEVSLNAGRTVELANSTGQSVLPGKVSIFLDGAFMGMTETEYVAPNESFAVYLGVAEYVKISRTLDRKHSELRRGGQRTKMQVSFLVTVENLSGHPVSVQLADRIPVSQSEDVKVSGIKVVPDVKPDVKGMLRWDVALPPRKTREFRLEYTLDYPTDLPRLGPPAVDPATGLPASSEIHDQIRILEKRF